MCRKSFFHFSLIFPRYTGTNKSQRRHLVCTVKNLFWLSVCWLLWELQSLVLPGFRQKRGPHLLYWAREIRRLCLRRERHPKGCPPESSILPAK